MLLDFSDADEVARWFAIDDRVMGGVSRSGLEPADGAALFRGFVSRENGGGFASVRRRDEAVDLSDSSGLLLRVCGDGKRYVLRVRTTPGFDGVAYHAPFSTRPDETRDIRLSFEQFEPMLRGARVPEAPALDPSGIMSFGLMISDGQVGPFLLRLERLRALPPGGE